MPELRWINRDTQGRVRETFAVPQYEGQESLLEGDAELLEFEQRLAHPELNMTFPDFVVSQVKRLDSLVLNFVYERYPQHRQITLTKLLTDARLAGKAEAVAYLQQLDDWLKTVFGAYYQLEDQIKAIAENEGLTVAERQAQILAVVAAARATVLEPLGTTDPQTTIRRSLELLA
jgi:hypothetical protein